MRNPDEFDAFYKDARDRLLLQTYALTGDLPASRAAVRDSFVVAWHHWRKISRLEDPESWARPHAWSHAQRRHTGRLWRREKGLAPADRATLDALGKLPVTQRKTLLLTHLTTVSMADMAREVGLPPADAERELQTATAQFAVHRDVPTTSIRVLFEGLRRHVETA
jgi:DNA-directed RNA polymerase specialized sigma24 family protein